MRAWLVLLVGLVVITLEGVALDFFGINAIALNMPLCIAIYLGLNKRLVGSSVVMLLLLLPAEWSYSAPFGYHALGLTAVFLCLRLVRGFVQSSVFALFVVCFLSSLLQAIVMVCAIFLSRTEAGLIAPILWGMLPAAAVVGMVAPLVVWGFRKLEPSDSDASSLSFG